MRHAHTSIQVRSWLESQIHVGHDGLQHLAAWQNCTSLRATKVCARTRSQTALPNKPAFVCGTRPHSASWTGCTEEPWRSRARIPSAARVADSQSLPVCQYGESMARTQNVATAEFKSLSLSSSTCKRVSGQRQNDRKIKSQKHAFASS